MCCSLGSAISFAGLGIGNVLLPPLVKKYFPDRIGLVTTLYVTMLSVSTFIPPLLAVPVADAAGWRVSLGMWAVVGLLAVMPWIGAHRTGAGTATPTLPSRKRGQTSCAVSGGRRSRWSLAAVFATLLAERLRDVRLAAGDARQDIAGHRRRRRRARCSRVFAAMGFPAGLLIPVLAARMSNVALLVYLARRVLHRRLPRPAPRPGDAHRGSGWPWPGSAR